ncbi:MAG: metallophosphoesterase family protein [Candidatus Omnitrophota bacterium]|jgi:predicted phosphodiesterase
MRYGIISDIHSNLEAFQAVLQALRLEHIDEYLCAGDIVGYAADPQACIDIVKDCVRITVAGNHDQASVELFSDFHFNPYAQKAISWTKKNISASGQDFLRSLKLTYQNKDLTLVHGSLACPGDFKYISDPGMLESSFDLMEGNICFLGHTHEAGIFIQDSAGKRAYQKTGSRRIEKGSKYIVNVGSIGQPRDSDARASYGIYDTDTRQVTLKRVDYDVHLARKKIIERGLPCFLGDRLLVGK